MVKITHRHPLLCSCKISSASTMSTRGIGPVLSGHPGPHRLGIAANTVSSHWNNADPSIEIGPRWRSNADTLRRVHQEVHRRQRYPHEASGQSSQDSPDLTGVGSRQQRARIGTVLASRSSAPYGRVQAQTRCFALPGLHRRLRCLHEVSDQSHNSLDFTDQGQRRSTVGPRRHGDGPRVRVRHTVEFTHSHFFGVYVVCTRYRTSPLRAVWTSQARVNVEAQWAHVGTVTDLAFEYGPRWKSRTVTSSPCSPEGRSVRRHFATTS